MKAKRILAAMLTMAMLLTSSGFTSVVYADTLDSDASASVETVVEEGNQETPAEEETIVTEDAGTEVGEETTPADEDSNEGEEVLIQGPEETPEITEELLEDVADENDAALADEETTEEGTLEALPEADAFFSVDGSGVLVLDDSALPALIPSTVVLPDGVEVIPSGIFDKKSPLKSVNKVTLRDVDALKEVGDGAFEGSPITSFTLGYNCHIIGKNAFLRSKINSVSLANVLVVGESAFEDTKITSVNLKNVRIIGDRAFAANTTLSSISWPTEDFDLRSADPDVENPDQVLEDMGFIESGDPVLYDYYVGDSAFTGSSIIKINLGDNPNAMYAGASMFSDSLQLTSVQLPVALAEISDSMFADCPLLTSVSMKYPKTYNATTAIGTSAFENCVKLVRLEVGLNVNKVGAYAFSGCTALTSVTFYEPTGNVEIATDAFTVSASKTHVVSILGYDGLVKEYVTNTIKEKGYKFVSLNVSYSIKGISSSKGSVSVQNSAQPETSINVKITPASGYALKNLDYVKLYKRVNSTTREASDVTFKLVSADNTSITLNFEMPDYDLEIEPTFVSREKLIKGDLRWAFDPGSVLVSQDRKELTFNQIGYSATIEIFDAGDNNAVISPWNFKMTTDKPDFIAISGLGVISAIEKGEASISIKPISGSNKSISLLAHVLQHIVIDKVEFDATTFVNRYNSEAYFLNYYPAGDSDPYADPEYPVIELDADVVANSDILLNMNMLAYKDGAAPNLIVKSTWSASDKRIVRLTNSTNIDTVTSNSDVIKIVQGSVGEVFVKFRVDNRYNDNPKFVENGVIIRVLSPTPRNSKVSIEVNKQCQGGTELDIVEVYGYRIDYAQPFTVHYKTTSKGVTTYPEYDWLRATSSNEKISLVATKNCNVAVDGKKVLTGNTQVYLRGTLILKNGGRRYFYLPFNEVVIVNKAISVKPTYTGKINTFFFEYTDKGEENYVTVNFNQAADIDWSRADEIRLCGKSYIDNPDPENDPFANNFVLLHEDMEADCYDHTKTNEERAAYMLKCSMVLRRTHEPFAKKNNATVSSGYIMVPFVGYTSLVPVKVSIPLEKNTPAYALEKSTVKVSRAYDNAEYQIELRDTKETDKVKRVVDLSDVSVLQLNHKYTTTYGAFDEDALDDHIDKDKITFKLIGDAKTANAVLMVQKPNWSNYMQFTFKTKLAPLPAGSFVKNSLGLNTSAPSQTAEMIMVLNQDNVKLVDFDNVVYTGKSKNPLVQATGLILTQYVSFDSTPLTDDEVEKGYAGKLIADLSSEPNPEDLTPGKYTFTVQPVVVIGCTHDAGDPCDCEKITCGAVKFTIVLSNRMPGVSLKKGTFTLNSLYGGKGEKSLNAVSITNVPARSTFALDFSGVTAEPVKANYPAFDSLFTIDNDDDNDPTENKYNVKVSLKKKVWTTFKYQYLLSNIGLTVDGDSGSDTYTIDNLKITITGTVDTPTIKLKASGGINPVCLKDEYLTYTMKIGGINGNIAMIDPSDPTLGYEVNLEEINPKTGNFYKDGAGKSTSKHFIAVVEHKDPDDEDTPLVTRIYAKPEAIQAKTDGLEYGRTYQCYISYKLKETDAYLPAVRLNIKPSEKLAGITQNKKSDMVYAGVPLDERFITFFVTKNSRERSYIAEEDVYDGPNADANRIGIGTRISTKATDEVKRAFEIDVTSFYRLDTDDDGKMLLTTEKYDDQGTALDIATYDDFIGVADDDINPASLRIVKACLTETHMDEDHKDDPFQCVLLDADGIPVETKGKLSYGAQIKVIVKQPSAVRLSTATEVPLEIRYMFQNKESKGKNISIKVKVMR